MPEKARVVKLPTCLDESNCSAIRIIGTDKFFCIGRLRNPIMTNGEERHSLCIFANEAVRILMNDVDVRILRMLLEQA